MAKKRKKKSKAASAVLTVLILLCLAVMGYSGYRLISTALEYRRGVEEYDDLRQYAVAVEPNTAAEAVVVEEEVEEEESPVYIPPCPLTVDWASLKSINTDIVGWIYIGALNVSYPVVHGEDNDFYLHRTFEKNYNFAGSIFMEYQNRSDFSDPNTIVYGHNMRNGSMFGTLKRLSGEELYKNDPYFWILTPEKDYCYKMFSLHVTSTTSDVYTLFKGTDEKFIEWAENMRGQSVAEIDPTDVDFALDSHIVTLSTCTGDSATRYVAQGLRLN